VRRFRLHRHTTGVVAEGIEFSDGTVALRHARHTTVYGHIDDVDHAGAEVVWLDAPYVCAICLDRFTDSVELMQHLDLHARNVETGGR
jgi:hypothetical protein